MISLLVRLVGEHGQRVVVRQLVAHEALVVLHDLAHLGCSIRSSVSSWKVSPPGSSKS